MDIEKLLNDLLKLPETLDEAITFVKKNPIMSSTVEEIAFKQTVINVLIAAGLVTENDFNASVEYFKNTLYEEFGKELLRESQDMRAKEDEDIEEDDWPVDDEKIYQA